MKVDSKRKLQKYSLQVLRKRMKRIVSAIRVDKFNVDLDTNDFILNSWIYPVGCFLQYRNIRLRVNYSAINEVDIKLSTRPVKIIWALLF